MNFRLFDTLEGKVTGKANNFGYESGKCHWKLHINHNSKTIGVSLYE
jgi:hypothetical protein